MTPKPRRIGIWNTDSVQVILMCAHRNIVGITAVFEVKEFTCHWCETLQPWISFEGSDKGYWWRCKRGGCNMERKYHERFLTFKSAAESHSRIHAHTVDLYTDLTLMRTIKPATLDIPELTY